jgi:pyruvate/2-oxoglutarate dehydrogenase complex dihydrolipoamide dehydrogenase (E3) component
MTVIDTDLCVIGAGSGGLSVAAGAVQMGARTVLVERGRMGGDCLNFGCVPSKALIAAARTADAMRRAGRFGIRPVEPEIDFAAVNDHVHDVIAGIAPTDSVERFEGLGVTVLQAEARFTGPGEIVAGDTTVRAKRFVLATGSTAAVPPIPGLDGVPFLTNESLFDLRDRPERLIVIGGGPIGMEMAQAHARLGSAVTVVEQAQALAREDADLVAAVRPALARDGVEVLEGTAVRRVEKTKTGIAVIVATGEGPERRLDGSHLLVATGRKPTVDGLGLDAAGVAVGKGGVEVDARLRTTNKRIFAVGDVAGGPQFTHLAGYHAGIVIRNALFRLPAKIDLSALPRVTYLDPELAQVGLTEAEARAAGHAPEVLTWPLAENDRARAERATEGLAKAVVGKGGRILGAGIAGPHAGELIQPWVLAIQEKRKIGALASMIAPYPTLGEVSKRAAGAYYAPKLFSDRTRTIVRWLLKLG